MKLCMEPNTAVVFLQHDKSVSDLRWRFLIDCPNMFLVRTEYVFLFAQNMFFLFEQNMFWVRTKHVLGSNKTCFGFEQNMFFVRAKNGFRPEKSWLKCLLHLQNTILTNFLQTGMNVIVSVYFMSFCFAFDAFCDLTGAGICFVVEQSLKIVKFRHL
jgi:hypothetical protein